MDLGVLATVFGLMFVLEFPDKTAIASLVLGTRFRASWVFAGVAAAFLVHVVLAVAAGSLIGLLPHRPLEAIVGVMFAIGAALLWFGDVEGEGEKDGESSSLHAGSGFGRVAGASFMIVLVAEFGDITQILCANLAARYHAPFTVGLGSVLGLWSAGLLAILGGKTLLRVLPLGVIIRTAAAVMGAMAVYSVVGAARG